MHAHWLILSSASGQTHEFIIKNKLTSGFHASVLFLTMNFVIMGQRSLQIHSAMALWIHSYFDNVMMKFMISNRTDMWETDVNLLNLPSTGTVHIIKLPGEGLNAFTLSSNRLQIFDEDKLGSNSFIGETCVTLKIFHSKPFQSLRRSLVARASVSMKFNMIQILYFSVCICFFFPWPLY